MRKASGFTLIEVMCASAIFAIGFLGLMQLQVIAARSASSARRITEATALANALAAKLQVLAWTSPLLNDATTGNDSPLDGSGSYSLRKPGAVADHCLGATSIPQGWVACATDHAATEADIKGMALPVDAVDVPGDAPLYSLAWDVQDVSLGGDLQAGVFDAKVVVARVLWRDPVMANQMRSEEVVVFVNNPSIARN